ncbi:MAG: response regulator [Thalassotalea sp.]|nr:response regulator [Thalassotalea sp.]
MPTYEKNTLKNNPYALLTAIVVDNNSTMNTIIKSMLIEIGFKRIITAANGILGLDQLKRHRADLIISDWDMPKMNGLGLLQTIRKNSDYAKTPFLMLTANVNPHDVKQAILSGVSEYLLKPFTSNTLKEKIHRAFLSPIPKHTLTDVSTKSVSEENNSTELATITNSILIVDDEPNNITVLTELLKEKYSLLACLSGAKALELCNREELPDLILLDIMMPKMDGLDVCKALKSNPLTEHIPIIFISALSETNDVVKGLSFGAVDYITKPITPEITLARISVHMKQVIQRQEMALQLDTMIENMRLKEDIERIIQHDLMHPLSTIISAADSLKEQKKYITQKVDLITQSAMTMQQKIDTQIIIQQLEDNSIKRDLLSVNALELFNKVVYAQKEKCRKSNVLVEYNITKNIDFLADQHLCFHLFTHLLINAIEASPENGEINISVEQDANNSGIVIFHINNQGIIPEKIQARFFDKFITEGKPNGTGLGTYLAKLAVLIQQGDIRFSSSNEQGTTLSVSFKVAP